MKITIETNSYALVNAIARAIGRHSKNPPEGDYLVKISMEFEDKEMDLAKPIIIETGKIAVPHDHR